LLLLVGSLFRPPKRRYPKIRKQHGESRRNRDSIARHFPRRMRPVFVYHCNGSNRRKDKEEQSCYFQPQRMQHTGE
jgi:hypothetical protein